MWSVILRSRLGLGPGANASAREGTLGETKKATTMCLMSTSSAPSAADPASPSSLHRSALFSEEQSRQRGLVARLEKFSASVLQPRGRAEALGEDQARPHQLVLNNSMSTPYHAAKHINESVVESAALSLVDGQLWDLHRPITVAGDGEDHECTIEFLRFTDKDPYQVNRAFWRSCSFLLGAVLETVFKQDIQVQLHSFPAANVSSGSFVHDAELVGLNDWRPSKRELQVLSAAMHRLAERALPFERLDITSDLASEMFKDNPHKLAQIPSIAAASLAADGAAVTVYRVGDHVDISRGPMVADTGFLGRRCTVAAAHPISHDNRPMYRFQGVALPRGTHLSHFAFDILEKRAAVLNKANLPAGERGGEEAQNTASRGERH